MTDNLENEANASTSEGNESSNLFSGGDLKTERNEAQAEDENSEKSEKNAENTESVDTQAEAETKPEGEQEAGQEPEKIVTTQAEKDAEAMRIREIERRKARREAEQEVATKYEQELEKIRQQQIPQQQQAYVPPAPSPNHIWVPELGQWIDPNMSLQDYAQLANQAQPQAGYNQQPINQQPNVATQPPEGKPLPQFSKAALNQADENVVRIKDFKEVMMGAPISAEMANAACLDPNGLNNLYQMAKDAPHELYKILQLPAEEQKERMWLMNQKFANEKAEKFKSKATPQAAPLNNSGEVSKDESSMDVAELKRKKHAQYWNEAT
jgi:hypothetical protein